jgi:hypothetical protein
MFHNEQTPCRRIHRRVGLSLVVILLVAFGATLLGQRGTDWVPIVEQLRLQPSPELLAELVHQVLEQFGEGVSERIVLLLAPQHTILYCAGTGCLGLVLITPPNVLVAGQTRAGASRAYNQGEIVGLLGTFGNTVAPDLEGFFLLRSNPDGSVGLLDKNGEQVTALGAVHAFRETVAPLLIPDPERGSVLLPERMLETTLEIEGPAANVSAESRSPIQITIGAVDEVGFFSGVALCGAIPITVP